MVTIDGDTRILRVTYRPRLYLALYLALILAAVIFATRFALAGERGMALALAGGGGAIGLGAILTFFEATGIQLDREAGTATIEARRAFGARTRVIALAQVAGVVNDSSRRDGKGGSLRPVFALKDGTRLQTRQTYIPARASQKMVAAMADWLSGGDGGS